MMIAYTNAPDSYDYGYVQTLEAKAGTDYAGNTYRKI